MAKQTNVPTLFTDLPDTPGGAIAALAAMKGQQDSGALSIAHSFPTFADDCMVAFGKAKKAKASVRDSMLAVWRDTPEGGYHEATKREMMLTPPKLRSEAVKIALAAMKPLENRVAIQMQRVADTHRGLNILRTAEFHVVPEMIQHSRTWICQFRNEKGMGEQSNQKLTCASLVQIANLKVHGITSKTTATEVLNKLTSKRKKSNKDKGNAANPVADVVNSKTGEVLAALDTRLAALCDTDKHLIDGVSAATRKAALQVWARLDFTISDDDKATARAEFNALAAYDSVTKPKVKRTPKAA